MTQVSGADGLQEVSQNSHDLLKLLEVAHRTASVLQPDIHSSVCVTDVLQGMLRFRADVQRASLAPRLSSDLQSQLSSLANLSDLIIDDARVCSPPGSFATNIGSQAIMYEMMTRNSCSAIRIGAEFTSCVGGSGSGEFHQEGDAHFTCGRVSLFTLFRTTHIADLLIVAFMVPVPHGQVLLEMSVVRRSLLAGAHQSSITPDSPSTPGLEDSQAGMHRSHVVG